MQVRAGGNPDRGKTSRRPDTEPCMARGDARCEAWGKELAGRNASEGIELRKIIIMEADRVRLREGRMTTVAKARPFDGHRPLIRHCHRLDRRRSIGVEDRGMATKAKLRGPGIPVANPAIYDR